MKLEKICFDCPEEVQKACAKGLKEVGGTVCDIFKEGEIDVIKEKDGKITITDGEVFLLL